MSSTSIILMDTWLVSYISVNSVTINMDVYVSAWHTASISLGYVLKWDIYVTRHNFSLSKQDQKN